MRAIFSAFAAALVASFTALPTMAAAPTNFGSNSGVICPGGNVFCNGSINFLTTELFFEPETPPLSLKMNPPIWNEIEQLLDYPNGTLSWGAACNDASGRVPGNEQGYPTYCTNSTFIRRPNFTPGITLPPLLVHPLNYNPATGTELRLLNPNYASGNFQTSGTVHDQFSVSPTNPTGSVATGVCYTLGTSCTPISQTIAISSGASRLAPGETVIDNNSAYGRELANCQTNPEPVPLANGTYTTVGISTATAFDAESLSGCGADPGEPGAGSRAHNTRNLNTCRMPGYESFLCEDNVGLPATAAINTTWYSVPAVPAPTSSWGIQMQIPGPWSPTCTQSADPSVPSPCAGGPSGGALPGTITGTATILDPAQGFYLTDPARGGVIQPYNPSTGAGGLHKPSLRKAEVNGNGYAPNYLWNSLAAASGARPDPTGANLQPSNENDFVGLYGSGDYRHQKENARLEAMVMGKSLFWDMQVGSDGVQACGSCHAHAGADNRTRNQINPNGQDGTQGAPTNFSPGVFAPIAVNADVQQSDFPLLKLRDPEIAGDPVCTPPIVANVAGFTFPDGDPPDHPKNPSTFTVCDAANRLADTEEVLSSMGVHFGLFNDIPDGTGSGLGGGAFGLASNGVKALVRDKRSPIAADNLDPIVGFTGATGNQFRRVEPRNTPTIFAADLNFDNFWDGRARHDDNGGSVFGASDPQSHVFVDQGSGTLTATRQIIKFSSLGALAKGPALSKFEMSFNGRNWAKIGKKLLQPGVTPLANQLVDPTDSILGRYSNQNGSACAVLPAADRSPEGGPPTALGTGVPGLCITYQALIRHAFYPALYQNTSQHLNGCYTDGRADIHPNQCGVGIYPPASIAVLDPDGVVRSHNNDPFDSFVLNLAPGQVTPTDTNQFTQMEANFSLFWGQSIHLWATLLMPDDTPFDKLVDRNPDLGATTGETGEPLLVTDLPNCSNGSPQPDGSSTYTLLTGATYTYTRDSFHGSCFTEVGNFKRDPYNPNDLVHFQNDTSIAGHPRMTACIAERTGVPLEGALGTRLCTARVQAGGTRQPNDPDPLLGLDIFFGSNVSLKNPNFRSARCGACHNAPTLTDNTFPFTVKATELDAFAEFEKGHPDIEPTLEPLNHMRVISGFFLEEEINAPGQDAIERRAGNLSLVPAPVVNNNPNCTTASCSGYVFPDGITTDDGALTYRIHSDFGSGPNQGAGAGVPFTGFGGAFFDNGVYNIGVRPCVANQTQVIGACEDTGRGNNDPFGWPLSLSLLLMKNFGGPGQQPGVPIPNPLPNGQPGFDPRNANIPPGRTDASQCAPYCSSGGLLTISAHDQHINPGYTDDVDHPQVPPYLAPFLNKIPVGDAAPQIDEGCGPAAGACPNTLMDVANEEGFPEFPFDPRPFVSEVINSSVAPGDALINLDPNGTAGVTSPIVQHGSAQMGTWPVVNRVSRFGAFKAPQIREVELTGPYFHNGGKLTLRQVIDFYVRGGDFPVTNSQHRDLNILNFNGEIQSDLDENEKVALVDFLLELTDDRVKYERAPFDHPQMILPLDGTAPESDGTVNRDVMLSGCVDTLPPNKFGPGQKACNGGMFLNVPASGSAGTATPLPNFLGVTSGPRLVGQAAFCAVPNNHYCH